LAVHLVLPGIRAKGRSRGALDPDPDPTGSKQSGSSQPDSLPCSSTNHCKHTLCFITQV